MSIYDIEKQINYLNFQLRRKPTVKNMKRLEELRRQHEQLVREGSL